MTRASVILFRYRFPVTILKIENWAPIGKSKISVELKGRLIP